MKDHAPDQATPPDVGAVGATGSPANPPSPQPPVSPPQIPDHDLIRPIGHGAYGEVWLARHGRLGTLRAVKIVRRDQFDDARPFQREFDGIRRYEPLSRGHPNLVAILHVGGTEECLFYVMELADDGREPAILDAGCLMLDERKQEADTGKQQHPESRIQNPESYSPHTLRSELKRHGPLPIGRCLEIGLALAGALAHLHARGLVHRDVKPSNVIFVGGVAKLADIGLVAAVSDSRSFVGTEGYIPPEGPGAPSADCYALGKLLYELSTGHDRTAWPEPPADLPTRPDRERLLELNTILHKACAAEARQRYQSAEELHGDLVLLQRGESVKRKRIVQGRWALGKKIAWVAASTALIAVVAYGLLEATGKLRSHRTWFSVSNPAIQGSSNGQAWKLYQEGLYSSRKRTPDGMQAGIDKFQEAIRLDPRFALAHAGLFEMYIAQANNLTPPPPDIGPKLRAAARALMELDDNLAETHAAKAWVLTDEWRWAEAEREYLRAIQINPNYLFARAHYGFWLSQWGRAEESRRELLRADEIDPTFPLTKKNLGHPFFVARDFTNALAQYQKAIDLEPGYPLGHYWLGRAHQGAGNIPAAIDAFERWESLKNTNRAKVEQDYQSLRQAYAESGVRGYWSRWLELTTASSSPNTYRLAEIHARLGDIDAAFAWLEKAYEQRNQMEYLIFDECWDLCRTDPRFRDLLKRVGFTK
jgi:tetratricopeptide (TPR) repeat protein